VSAWESFYVIVGSAGAALIGIQFVVVTLIASLRRRPTAEAVRAFATPTVVHFAGALVVSAVMASPWPSLEPASIVLTAWGAGGLVYCVATIRRTLSQTEYEPVWQDWVWYALLPAAAYAALALAAFLLSSGSIVDLFVIGGSALTLLLIGIHNAWDTVTHVVLQHAQQADMKPETAMNITRSGSRPSSRGPADYFTGTVRVDPLFEVADPGRAVGASVTFEPGARTAWHTHPLGQTLIVVAGAGRAQRWGGPIEDIRPGDVIAIAAGEKHWHGAAPATAMTHIAIQERLDGKTVEWMEKVTDEQYGR
jgi:quercetin dioxygenase-like cupin family protein